MDISQIKSQFPIFRQPTPKGNDFVYLDNAATSQKPQCVIDAITRYYSEEYSTVGRGAYWPASINTARVNEVRSKVKTFLNAASEREIVFTSGTTDGINKVARNFLAPRLTAGDHIIISEAEHHANLIPWQQLCLEKGAELKVIPVLESGVLDESWLASHLNDKVKLLAVSACSNVLGIKNDLNSMISLAHEKGIPVLVDAAQTLCHDRVDVMSLNCDFLLFSAHKMFGPTGVGVLYGKAQCLEQMKPFNYGGGIVKEVTMQGSSFQDLPAKHEAGTANISGILGMGAALDFILSLDEKETAAHLSDLTSYALDRLESIEGLKIMGGKDHKAPLISFTLDGIHPHDISTFLSEEGICVRAGHHCAQPLMHRFQIPASIRASFAVYNDRKDIDRLYEALLKTQSFFL
ncbi:aminotransferase class V-fold PLP-dependent enzyme [Roseivirga sp.]|uniref:aminotransferase class V-fold PLP-dependent enzyme n=1 Tax=Roseivirga sp. TaxID=1964215 RepID=UPI003B52CA86